jgi:DNA-directed RNA polymerase sigma subunit (sigma70/sigma32)
MERGEVDACATSAVDDAYERVMSALLPTFRATEEVDLASARQDDYERIAAQLRRAIQTTALNAFRDAVRRHLPADRAAAPSDAPERGSTLDPLETVASDAPGPEQLVIERLLVDEATRMLSEDLSGRERIVVELYHGIGVPHACSFQKIAGFLAATEGKHVSKQMIARIYNRAMKKMRATFGRTLNARAEG